VTSNLARGVLLPQDNPGRFFSENQTVSTHPSDSPGFDKQRGRAFPGDEGLTRGNHRRIACLAELTAFNLETPVVIDSRDLCGRCGGSLVLHAADRLRLVTILPPPIGQSKVRLAWERRQSILSPAGRPLLACAFLELISRHAHELYPVPAAATALRMSVRKLHYLSLQWLGQPPGRTIAMTRIRRAAREIRDTQRSLSDIAEGHGYASLRAFRREFALFTGLPPRGYRLLALLSSRDPARK
jgi:AraC-like DNA-binding protein